MALMAMITARSAQIAEGSISQVIYEIVNHKTIRDFNYTPRAESLSVNDAKRNGAKVLSHFVSNKNVNKVTFSLRSELQISNDDGSNKSNSIRFAILISRSSGEYNILDSSSGCSVSYDDSGGGLSHFGIGFHKYFRLYGIATSAYQFDINVSFDPVLNSSEISGGVTFKIIKLSKEYDPTVKGSGGQFSGISEASKRELIKLVGSEEAGLLTSNDIGGIGKQRSLQLAHVVESIDEKLLYPNTAMCKILIDSKNFSQSPERAYHIKMKKVLVPGNYDPVSRKYEGPWNGLFKGQTDAAQSINEISDSNKYWTDNPAWIFFDLLHNSRYGLGKYGLEETNIDKWQLYKISKYCDQLVETNYPVETSTSKPRTFTFEGKRSSSNFSVLVDLSSDSDFISEFGDGTSMSGKRVAFFIAQHNYGNGNLSSSQIDSIKSRSMDREGEIVIEERTLISANPQSKTLYLSGPNFGDNPAAFGTSNKVIGSCANQINHPIVEPRFTANLYLTERSEAMQVINSMAAIFRGMAIYSGGKISATYDSYKNPIQLFNNSNVVGGDFQYAGVYKNKKATASIVRFNNKDKNFKPDLVYEEDAASMQSVGYIENETMGFGITSESQARRLAKWVLMTSQLETETIKFIAGQEASYLSPGSIFEVSDEIRTNNDKSGRVLDVQLYRSRIYEDEDSEFQELVNEIYDPYILIDKDNTSTPSHSRIELSVYCGQTNETIDDIDRRASFEKSEIDQDQEIESLRTPQILRFEGSIYTDPGIDDYGPQGQKTIVSDLSLKLPIEVSLPDNLIKCYNHGLSNGDRLYFTTEGILPGGIKASGGNSPNYYVVDSTKHTFKISESLGGSSVNIFSHGKDRFKNDGGLQYAVTQNSVKINAAMDQINLGAAYSIKGLIGTKSDPRVEAEQREKLGIYKNFSNGWSKSDFLGTLLLRGDWAYVYGLGWVYVKHLKERNDGDSFWFYLQDIGWIWTNNDLKNSFWWIQDKNYDSANHWSYVLYNNSSRDAIVGFFAYDTSAGSSPLKNGSHYKLGKSRKILIRKRLSFGYFVSNESNFSYYGSPSSNVDYIIGDDDIRSNPNYSRASIDSVYAVDAEISIQGERAVRVELTNGHGLNLFFNGRVNVDGSTSINGAWNIVRVDENIIELVASSSTASLISGIQTGGFLSLVDSLTTQVDRFLEGQLFRTLSVKEISENKYEVTGLEYNYSKFVAVDKKGTVRSPSLPIPPQADMQVPEAPDGLLLFDLTV